MAENVSSPNIFIDILLRNILTSKYADSFDPKMLQSEVNTFILGGHDTTAATLTFSLLMIGGAPEIQDKVNQELFRIFKGMNLMILKWL